MVNTSKYLYIILYYYSLVFPLNKVHLNETDLVKKKNKPNEQLTREILFSLCSGRLYGCDKNPT